MTNGTPRRASHGQSAAALCLLCASVAMAGPAPDAPAQGPVVIERSMALVGSQVITLSDVRTLSALGLVETTGGDPVVAATERLIARALMLREVQRYAPGEPSEAEIDTVLAGIRARYGTEDDVAQVLASGGFTVARLRAWVRDDLRIAGYLNQRFTTAGVPSDQDIGTYYAAHREEFERSGLPFEEVVPLVRARLAGERRRELIADWVAGLRRRTEVVELYRRQ